MAKDKKIEDKVVEPKVKVFFDRVELSTNGEPLMPQDVPYDPIPQSETVTLEEAIKNLDESCVLDDLISEAKNLLNGKLQYLQAEILPVMQIILLQRIEELLKPKDTVTMENPHKMTVEEIVDKYVQPSSHRKMIKQS